MIIRKVIKSDDGSVLPDKIILTTILVMSVKKRQCTNDSNQYAEHCNVVDVRKTKHGSFVTTTITAAS